VIAKMKMMSSFRPFRTKTIITLMATMNRTAGMILVRPTNTISAVIGRRWRSGGRKRHRYFQGQDIPSFAEFHRRAQVRSLYRQFMRLLDSMMYYPPEQWKPDLRKQFQHGDLLYGQQRYRELLRLQPALQQKASVPAAKASVWPWNAATKEDEGEAPSPPGKFPPKSNL
jgi:hypothetical protein